MRKFSHRPTESLCRYNEKSHVHSNYVAYLRNSNFLCIFGRSGSSHNSTNSSRADFHNGLFSSCHYFRIFPKDYLAFFRQNRGVLVFYGIRFASNIWCHPEGSLRELNLSRSSLASTERPFAKFANRILRINAQSRGR